MCLGDYSEFVIRDTFSFPEAEAHGIKVTSTTSLSLTIARRREIGLPLGKANIEFAEDVAAGDVTVKFDPSQTVPAQRTTITGL